MTKQPLKNWCDFRAFEEKYVVDLATLLGVDLKVKVITSPPKEPSFLPFTIIKTLVQRNFILLKNLMQFAIIQSKCLNFKSISKIMNKQRLSINNYSSGPIFGAGADLLISSNCNANMDSYSNMPHTYDGDMASPSILMGDYNFTVADYEVFTPLNNAVSSKISKNERYQ